MSDVEQVEAQEVVEVEASAPGQMSVEEALQGALKISLAHNGLARGLRSASKALSSRRAVLAVLCDSVTEEAYVKLVEALCNDEEHKVPLIKVSDSKKLGEWVGLAQLDREGNPRKVVKCGVAVITNWGKNSEEREVLLRHFENL